MRKATRSNRWRVALSASTLALALAVSGCSKLPGAANGGADASAAPDGAAVVMQAGVDSGSQVASSPAANPTPARPAGLAANQPVAAHMGSIAQTLSVVGKVTATQEVPLSFGERLAVKTVQVKPGQSVEAGQLLATADATDIQRSLDAAQQIRDGDTAALQQAQAAAADQQQAAAQQAQAAQATHAQQIAAAQANLDAARANLQKLQAGPSPADLQAAQNAVTAAQIAERKAETDQSKVAAGPDAAQLRSAEQALANAQAAASKAQADLDRLTGGQDSGGSGPAAAAAAENISPPGVSTDASNPANNYGFQGIAVDPSHSGTVYVGTSYQGLWKTSDAGHTWSKVNTGSNGKALDSGRLWLVVLDPTNSSTIYAAPGYGVGGLWKSTDGGVNWTALFPPNSPVVQALGGKAPTPSNLAIDPANHLHMLVSSHLAWGGKYASAGGSGVLETTDGGATWTIHDPIPGSGGEHEVAMLDGSTWLQSFNGGIYRTPDAGATWTKVSDVDGETQNLLVTNGAAYVPSPSGLLRSTDNGASWQTVGPGGMAVISDGSNLYTQESGPGGGHSNSLYTSPASDGTNWTQYSGQTMCSGGTCDGPGWMAYDAGSHTIYMSNWTAGVWKLQTLGGPPAPPAASKASAGGASDVLATQQRLQTAKDAVDAARAKLQALQSGSDQDAQDTAQLNVDSAQGQLQAAQARLNQLRSGPAPADLRAAQDAVAQAQAALNQARSAPVQQPTGADAVTADLDARQKAIDKDNATVAELQQRLAGTQLTAPFAGTVVSVRVKVGDVIDETRPALTLAQPGTPVVRATITPSDFDKISVGQSVQIQLPGQPDDTPPLTGTISTLTPNDAGTAKTADVQVNWPDTVPKLGTVVNLGFVLQQKDDALLVPKNAVHTMGSRTFVELVDGSSRRITDVKVGIIGATDEEVVSGLAQGQLVAIGP